MANMLRANQAAKTNYRLISPSVYGECTRCLLASGTTNLADGCQAFVPSGPSGSLEGLHCRFCKCHQNFHRRLDVDNHQPSSPPPSTSPTQQQVYSAPIVEPTIQSDVNMEDSSNARNANPLGLINTQMMFNSPGVSMALAESIMERATLRWVHINKKVDTSGNNKRKISWDELVAEEYKKKEPEILAKQLEWTSLDKTTSENEKKKNKKIKEDEKEKGHKFEMYFNNKREAMRKLSHARAGESSSSSGNDHNSSN